jgi:hypothetical protein
MHAIFLSGTTNDNTGVVAADLFRSEVQLLFWVVQEARQRSQSHAVLSELRSRGELLSDEQEKAALARLLGTKPAAVSDWNWCRRSSKRKRITETKNKGSARDGKRAALRHHAIATQ